VLQQGQELGRPSELHVRLATEGGELTLEVGGSAVIVARGQFTLPEAGGAGEQR
jgi:predicted PhzF superfamily epimerase YddE/YHI9